MISLSTGTVCDAKCPYCDLDIFDKAIAAGKDLIETTERFIGELNAVYSEFTVRITGGEPGLVKGLPEAIDHMNQHPLIRKIKIYTKGDVFDVVGRELLQPKSVLYEHLIHDVVDGQFVRYDGGFVPHDIAELIEHVETRRKQYNYRCVMVDTSTIPHELKKLLKEIDIKLYPQINRNKYRTGPPYNLSDNRLCYFSKRYYVYDVAHKIFLHCCEMKDPAYGYRSDSIINFLQSQSDDMYPQCYSCNKMGTFKQYKRHECAGRSERSKG